MSSRRTAFPAGPLPARAGIGLRALHYEDLVARTPAVGFLEVHSENYFGAGGAPLDYLETLRASYAVSLHGVGLSLGSVDPLNADYLSRLERLIRRFEPALVSDHLCWGSVNGTYLNDLLPLPYTEEALEHVTARVTQVQERLGRRFLIENVSSYLSYGHSSMPEWEFLAALAARSGCAILLDVNNVYVSARNHGFAPREFIEAMPVGAVQEIHLGGFAVNCHAGAEILIDDHGARVADEVWTLYGEALERFGAVPTLIEWDTNPPALDVLLQEAARADGFLGEIDAVAA